MLRKKCHIKDKTGGVCMLLRSEYTGRVCMEHQRKNKTQLALLGVVATLVIFMTPLSFAEAAPSCAVNNPMPELSSFQDILDFIIQISLYMLQVVVKFICGGLQVFGISCS